MKRWVATFVTLGAGALIVLRWHDLALALSARAASGAPLGGLAECRASSGLPAGWPADEHAGMVFIEGGSFVPGSLSGYPEERPAQPAPRVTVNGFWIDRTEVTNAQFAAFVRATGYLTRAERDGGSALFRAPVGEEAPAHLSWWVQGAGVSFRHPEGPGSDLRGRENLPVVHVAHEDALAYARWLGRTLPTEDQWEYAARGGRDDASLHGAPRSEQGQPTANFWQGDFPTENRAEDGFGAQAPVGCFAPNPYGLHDMIGNVWEWTADRYLPRGEVHQHEAGDRSPSCDDRDAATAHVIKGGSYLCSPNFCARYRVSARHGHDPTLPTSHIGFRTVGER